MSEFNVGDFVIVDNPEGAIDLVDESTKGLVEYWNAFKDCKGHILFGQDDFYEIRFEDGRGETFHEWCLVLDAATDKG